MLNRSFSVFTCVESLFGIGSVCLLPFLCLTWSFFSHRRVFRSKLENWKAKPAPVAQASPRSPCMPFSWFNESRKGSYSFRNLPSVPSPLLPSPETLVSDKTGSKVDNWTKKKKSCQESPDSYLLSIFGRPSQPVCTPWVSGANVLTLP